MLPELLPRPAPIGPDEYRQRREALMARYAAYANQVQAEAQIAQR